MLKSSGRAVIRLRGVRHNNLKNFDLDLPLNQLIVVTGLSGSGKSSLAFDTLFAEGQRRYLETFSPYARQFFDRMDKPQVDSIEGIPPAIAIEQRNAVRTTRSTVGTMTEICDYMKVVWPKIAQLHCRQCGRIVQKDSPRKIWEAIQKAEGGVQKAEGRKSKAECLITFDVPLSSKLSLEESLVLVARQGYGRLLCDGELLRLEEASSRLAPRAARRASLTVVQDRLAPVPANRARFVEACEQAYHFGKGKLAVHGLRNDGAGSKLKILRPKRFSNRFHCADCDIDYREPTTALFSFNHPAGACPACRGFGRIISIDFDLAIPDRSLTLAEGAIKPWRTGFSAECQEDLKKFCRARGVPMTVPFAALSREHQQWVVDGDPDYGTDEEHEWPRAWYGVKGYFRWLESKAYKMHVRVLLSRYRAYTTCPDCGGARFQPETLLYRLALDELGRTGELKTANSQSPIADSQTSKGHRPSPIASSQATNNRAQMTLADFYALPVRDALALVGTLIETRNPKLQTRKPKSETPNPKSGTVNPSDTIALALAEVHSRLSYLNEVGLGYVTLDRPTRTLSGGETERVNLTTCLGTRLVNTLFVLDEPSVGLHPRDTERLVRVLEQLRDAGNTVVVVEHEANVIRAADRIVDLGPGHGATGGHIVFQGTYDEIRKSTTSLTGQYLSGRRRIGMPPRRPVASVRAANRQGAAAATLKLARVTCRNLKNLGVDIPLSRFVCVTGVSGSGKSTLVREVLLPALERKLKSQISSLKSSGVKASDRMDDPGSSRLDEANGGDAEDNGVAAEGSESPEGKSRAAIGNSRRAVLLGWESLGRVVVVDQSILGKTPRSNPAVYTGAFDHIREFFAQQETARQRGLNASAFSFNSSQGQCERCRGAGYEKIEMQFLSDVFVRCPDCQGRRYRPHILAVKVSTARGQVSGGGTPDTSHLARDTSPLAWSIADLLEATVDEAIEFLGAFPDSRPGRRAVESLKLLQEVGLGYLSLGQPINTLSGGESQRLKLVRHLAEAAVDSETASGRRPSAVDSRPTLFLFDEPTTGLHFDDVRVLLEVFQRLVSAGHSVIVIEHNLDVIKSADWIIDLGPEAGAEGGRVVAQGPPEHIAACDQSHTGRFLRDLPELRGAAPARPTARTGSAGTARACRPAEHCPDYVPAP